MALQNQSFLQIFENGNFVLYNFHNIYIILTQKCSNWPKGMVSTPPT